jgi:glycosyltransferase involved in cell wall biosynthesis
MPKPDIPTILIFEADHEGHQSEWVMHLMRFAASDPRAYVLWFVLSSELHAIVTAEAPTIGDRIHLQVLKPWEQRLCRHRRLIVGAFARWWCMRRYLIRTRSEAGHFLSIDHLSLPLALGFGAGGRRLSGTLFRPSIHYPLLGCYEPTWSERIRDLRKALLYRLMLRNPAVARILSLDCFFPNYAATHFPNGAKVVPLNDPAHPPMNVSTEDERLADRLPSGRITFVLFGFLSERKGIRVLMQALQVLPDHVAGRVGVLAAGNVDPHIRAQVITDIEQLTAARPRLWFHLEDRRLTRGEIQAVVNRASVVLAPYQRFVGASGVMLWAAKAGKPILTQALGLIGYLVRTYRLGLAVDTNDPRALADGITLMSTHLPSRFIDKSVATQYVEQQTPQRFAQAVLDSLLH